jgi:hypothetical protein
MKKSFSPSKENRPSRRPSAPRSTGSSAGGGSSKGSFNRPMQVRTSQKTFTPRSRGADGRVHTAPNGSLKETRGDSKEFFGGAPTGLGKESYNPLQTSRRRGRWTVPLIVLLVLFVCCIIALCVIAVYLLTQGQLNLPSF